MVCSSCVYGPKCVSAGWACYCFQKNTWLNSKFCLKNKVFVWKIKQQNQGKRNWAQSFSWPRTVTVTVTELFLVTCLVLFVPTTISSSQAFNVPLNARAFPTCKLRDVFSCLLLELFLHFASSYLAWQFKHGAWSWSSLFELLCLDFLCIDHLWRIISLYLPVF